MKHFCYKHTTVRLLKKKFNSKLKAAKQSSITIWKISKHLERKKERKKERPSTILHKFWFTLRTENGKVLQHQQPPKQCTGFCNFVYYCLIVYRHEDLFSVPITMNASKFSWDIELLSLFLTNFSFEKLLSQAIWVIEIVNRNLYAKPITWSASVRRLYCERMRHTQMAQFLQQEQVLFTSSTFGSTNNGPPVSSSPPTSISLTVLTK